MLATSDRRLKSADLAVALRTTVAFVPQVVGVLQVIEAVDGPTDAGRCVVADVLPTFAVGTVANPISVMLIEHDRVGELLVELRTLTGGDAPPPDGCGSFEACYSGLEALEADTHLHVHEENNVLFPAVAAIERRLANEASP